MCYKSFGDIMAKGQASWWDVVIPKNKWKGTEDDIIQILDHSCKKWGIGREVGTQNGLVHWQIRLQTAHPCDMTFVMALFPGFHVCPTSKACMGNFDYIMKDGDYILSTERNLWKYRNLELKPWQGSAVADALEQSDRDITVIWDEEGGKGKTTLGKWLVANHKGTYIPPMTDGMDFMSMVMAKPEDKLYIFDIPRSESAKQKKGLWSAVEQVKNGYVYDKRYQWREKWINPPMIIVFTNEYPPTDALSYDRWRIYRINGEDELERAW